MQLITLLTCFLYLRVNTADLPLSASHLSPRDEVRKNRNENPASKACFAEFHSNMAIHFDLEDHTDFQDKEHADNETQCAELCCGGYTRLHEQNLIIEGKQSNTGEQYYCDAVMFSPSLGHLNCILLMCQLRNCTLEFQSEMNITSIILSKQRRLPPMYLHEQQFARRTSHILIIVFIIVLWTFFIFVLCLALFGHKLSSKRRGGYKTPRGTNSYRRSHGHAGTKKDHQEVPVASYQNGEQGTNSEAARYNRTSYDSCIFTPCATVDTKRLLI
ncbi:uncharacterized protein LOC142337951 [Convolutriloba macropyga]|uniref:uncharacterized protein LOC142337951 n=1 Tax=Convolutriloba macropyga TaxID=536237 RepID=UPI003F51E138